MSKVNEEQYIKLLDIIDIGKWTTKHLSKVLLIKTVGEI